MKIVLFVVYVVLGVLIAIPYCLLAGWSPENFPIVAFVAPVFLFVWLISAVLAGIIDEHDPLQFNWRAAVSKGGSRPQSVFLTMFWVWTLYSALPIIAHWSAMLLEKTGYETSALLIDKHRYASPLLIVIATFMLFTLIKVVMSALGTVKNALTRIAHR